MFLLKVINSGFRILFCRKVSLILFFLLFFRNFCISVKFVRFSMLCFFMEVSDIKFLKIWLGIFIFYGKFVIFVINIGNVI